MMIRKIVLLGQMEVGKTSIARRLKFNAFDSAYKSTIGQDIYHYDIDPPPNDDGFAFLIVDTDGKFDDAIFRDRHLKGAQAAIVVGDMTRRETLETQVDLIYRFSDAVPGRYIGCVFNKSDLVNEFPQDAAYIPEKLTNSSIPFLQTSAKTGLNVQQTFNEAARAIVRRGL